MEKRWKKEIQDDAGASLMHRNAVCADPFVHIVEVAHLTTSTHGDGHDGVTVGDKNGGGYETPRYELTEWAVGSAARISYTGFGR